MSSSHLAAGNKVVPAQLAFLTIYNPSFGNSDETAYDQILYFSSRQDLERRHQDKDAISQLDGGAQSKAMGHITQDEKRNERLRKVGLARGMVEFANTFSNGVSVHSIETEKSRIVLQELEPGWWILASVDLTRLPSATRHSSAGSTEKGSAVEYSSREVSPPQLLLQQLQQAYSIFLLHHAASLDELYLRLGRELFCSILSRFWDRFVRDWDVLLHGNPSAEMYNATKLAGGGELGIGVGEEEWGSGEREVLEDFVHRTDGLADVVVGRYGDGPVDGTGVPAGQAKKEAAAKDSEPWLGAGEPPRASDGIIFSGIGTLSKRSLATVSQWMEAIFSYGDSAYGVGENPSSRPRHRRKRRKPKGQSAGGDAGRSRTAQQQEVYPRIKSPRGGASDLRRKAMENSATPPGIPAPLVGTVERSLDQAIVRVQKGEGSQSGQSEAGKPDTQNKEAQRDTSYFDSEKMMNILKLGYGSAWTLNPKGFAKQSDEDPDPKTSEVPAPGEQEQPEEEPPLQELEPTPDTSETEEEETPFVQRLEQSIGKFLIGLSGDLENTEFDSDPSDATRTGTNDSVPAQSKPQRIFMRTLTVQLSKPHVAHNKERPYSPPDPSRTLSDSSRRSRSSDLPSQISRPTLASQPNYDKIQVAVYVHQPFIYVFLFDLHTSKLSMPTFYRSIHHQLGPLQKPLLRSTDPSRTSERILLQMDHKIEGAEASGIYDLVYDPLKLTVRTSIPNIPIPGTLAAEGILSPSNSASTTGTQSRTLSGAWYTLGIPVGSSTSSSSSYAGASSDPKNLIKSDWTRIEALNVHSQILHTWAATGRSGGVVLTGEGEIERTVKTARGWWVVWMRVPRSMTASGSANASGVVTPRLPREGSGDADWGRAGMGEREAFLVRKAVDSAGKMAREARSASSGKWLLKEQREVSGASGSSAGGGGGGGAVTSARGVVEGVGVDARKWVEGLVRLS